MVETPADLAAALVRIADLERFVMLLAERLAICSALLSKCAEKRK